MQRCFGGQSDEADHSDAYSLTVGLAVTLRGLGLGVGSLGWGKEVGRCPGARVSKAGEVKYIKRVIWLAGTVRRGAGDQPLVPLPRMVPPIRFTASWPWKYKIVRTRTAMTTTRTAHYNR
jgi:hypothetical protein